MRPLELRDNAYQRAVELLRSLPVPPGCALAATGSFARREMTRRSDLDLMLLCPDDAPIPYTTDLWNPVWDAGYHLDFAVRTPRECGEIAARDTAAGLSQLELTHVSGPKMLVDAARARLYSSWRRQLQRNFDAFLDLAIRRWHRSGSVATMTKPDVKNGRGGLRDIQLLRALALGNLCDAPDLSAETRLLLDVRTLLHEHARRRRDVLDPEFAASVAAELGYADRYELSAALVDTATRVDRAVERGLATARGLVGKRGALSPRRPLDLDVIDNGGYITLPRHPNLEDPALVLRVGAAAARTGRPVAAGVWHTLRELPALPERFTAATTDDFFALLSSPANTPRVIREMDAHGLWEKIVPEWAHIRGLMPRERVHTHSIDYHSLATVARCAEQRTSVARPDILLLAALFHDIGKGYDRPHALVGAEMVTRMAARLRLNLADRSRAQTLVAEHTTLSRLARTMDPASDAARDSLLTACHYDQLTVSLLSVLTRADAESTGPGVWNNRLEAAAGQLCRRALQALVPQPHVRPRVPAPSELKVTRDSDNQLLTVSLHADQASIVEVLALLAALGWTVVSSRMEYTGGALAAEFSARTVQESWEDASDVDRFLQAYKSGVHSRLPQVAGGHTTAMFNAEGLLEVRTVERRAALGTLIAQLPEIEWVEHAALGATMIVTICLRGNPSTGLSRAAVVANVTAALSSD
nr:[protein-PII] uridylyltransferase [Corynebacterium confusum]